MSQASPPALSVRGLACGRGERALFSNFDLTLASGEIVRLLGENGAGKTTLLRTLVGLLPPLAGDIRWQGADNGEVPVGQLCVVDFENALSGVLTPLENLRGLCRVAGDERVSDAAIRDVLASLGLGRLVHRPCGRLSSGQKRRISLARLWLTDAPIWLLDEPAAALDVDARAGLAARIAEHAAAGGSVLYTTHEPLDLAAARSVALT